MYLLKVNFETMKNIMFILTAIVLFISCSKENSGTTEVDSSFVYSLNEKKNFESELSLKIESINGSSLKVYKTENENINRFEKIIYSDENDNEFIIESNKSADTLYIYQRDINGNKISEALRYVKLTESMHKLEFVSINNDKSVTTLNQYILNKKASSNKSIGLKKSNDDSNDLDEEIDDTTEFLSDPTNTHPIVAFYKGILKRLFSDDEENKDEVFEDDSESTLDSFLDGLDSKRRYILEKLGEIKDILNEGKNNLKNFTKEQIDELIEKINEEELIDDDEIDDSFLKDCKGVVNGVAVVDQCGECVASFLEGCEKDCNGDLGGDAYFDNCNECIGGNTGKAECEENSFSVDINNLTWLSSNFNLRLYYFEYYDFDTLNLTVEDEAYRLDIQIFDYKGIGTYSFPRFVDTVNNPVFRTNNFRLVDKSSGKVFITYCENDGVLEIISVQNNNVYANFSTKICEIENGITNESNVLNLTSGRFQGNIFRQ